jgi:hypothetical protein
LKLRRDVISLFVLAISFTSILSAQNGTPSLGDLARQERERRRKQSDKSGQTYTQISPAKSGADEAGAAGIAGLNQGSFQANILITDSKAAIEKWILLPAGDRSGAGRFRETAPGKKIYIPFVVTNYPFQASEKMNLTAHVRISAPNGKTLLDVPTFSEAIRPDPRSPSDIVLNPVMDLTFDATDLPGTYTISVTITDHVHSAYAKAEEKVQLIQGEAASAATDR